MILTFINVLKFDPLKKILNLTDYKSLQFKYNF